MRFFKLVLAGIISIILGACMLTRTGIFKKGINHRESNLFIVKDKGNSDEFLYGSLAKVNKSRMSGNEFMVNQAVNDSLKEYKQYMIRYKGDEFKLAAGQLELAKLRLVTGHVKEALTIFLRISRENNLSRGFKSEALYNVGKIYLLYLPNIEKAENIFRGIEQDYEKQPLPETTWSGLWSMLRLAEICERRGDMEKAQAYLERVLNSGKINTLEIFSQLIIYTFAAEKYFIFGRTDKSLQIVESNLRVYKDYDIDELDWTVDWFIWLKMRIANYFYKQGNLKKTIKLYNEVINMDFLKDCPRLKTVFRYNLLYNPKPFPVDKEQMFDDLRISVEVLSKYFLEMKEQINIFEKFLNEERKI